MNTHKGKKSVPDVCSMITAMVLGTVQGIISLGTAILLTNAVDYALKNSERSYREFCALALAFYVVYIIVFSLSKWGNTSALKNIRINLKDKLFGCFLWQSHGEYVRKQQGDTLSLFQRMTETLLKDYYSPLIQLVRNAAVLTVSMGAMLVLHWYLGVLCAAVFAVYLLLVQGINRKLKEKQSELMNASITESTEMTIMLNSFQTAADYDAADYFEKRYREAVTKNDICFAKLNTEYNLLGVVNSMIEPVIMLAIIAIAGIILKFNSSLSIAGILGMTQLASSMLKPIGSLGSGIAQIKSTAGLRQAVRTKEKAAENGYKEWNVSGADMAELQEIKIEDMGFSYSSDPVLSDVDLTLKAGNKYAIVGESGGGKTTLINLILKLLTPTDGSISRNGTSYGDITCGDIISSVAYVGQDPVMLPADVRTNIITDKPYDKALLEKVITLSRLSEGRSPDEVEEFLSGNAESLSGGERKRVALARALYKQRSVLILDEVLSSVSKDMAVAMENAILALDGVMVIHITHSLFEEQRKKYDGIITVGQGKAEYTAVSAL